MTSASISLPSAEIGLDIRLLTGSEPAHRIFEALGALPTGATLVVRAAHEPILLCEMLAADGWSLRSQRRARTDWDLRIWRPEDER